MKKIIFVSLIFFSFYLLSYSHNFNVNGFMAESLDNDDSSLLKNDNFSQSLSLLPDESKNIYAPYSGKEFVAETFTVGFLTAISFIPFYNAQKNIDESNLGEDFNSVLMTSFLLPLYTISAPLLVYLIGNFSFKRDGYFLAAYAGELVVTFPFGLATKAVKDKEVFNSLITAMVVSLPFGIMLGYVSSQNVRQFDSGSLLNNASSIFITGAAGIALVDFTRTTSLGERSLLHAAPAFAAVTAGAALSLLISRNLIADEPDNAGTWGGVLGGTLIGATAGFLVGGGIKLIRGDSYLKETAPVAVLFGALIGNLAGFALTHTTVPGKENATKELVSLKILPPTVNYERIPIIEKKFTSWNILNLELKF